MAETGNQVHPVNVARPLPERSRSSSTLCQVWPGSLPEGSRQLRVKATLRVAGHSVAGQSLGVSATAKTQFLAYIEVGAHSSTLMPRR